MNQEHFERRYRDEWISFDNTLDRLDRKRELSSLEDFPHVYRRLSKQLALARDRQYSVHLVNELNALVLRAHRYLYKSKKVTLYGIMRVFTHDFPQAVRRDARLFWLSTLLFYGPLLAMIWAIHINPELAYSIIPPEQAASYEQMYNSPTSEDRTAADDVMMFGYYIQHNVGIAFRTFGSGLLFGVGAIITVLFNGVAIGAVAGYIVHLGFGDTFFRFVCGHASFELTAIVLAGMAGMKLGFALLIPGGKTRRQKLTETAHALLPVVYGMAVMLFIAAFIEAFWSPRTLTAGIKYGVSGFFWLLLTVYFLFSGRTHEN